MLEQEVFQIKLNHIMSQEKNNIQNNFDTSKLSWLKSGGSIEKLIKVNFITIC